jgi:hypothetical protein
MHGKVLSVCISTIRHADMGMLLSVGSGFFNNFDIKSNTPTTEYIMRLYLV